MADAKITALTELTTADGADLLPIVDDVAGTPTTKKITLTNIAAWLAALTQTLTNKTIGTSNLISFNSPPGFLINGKIVPSVASSDLTVAIKGMDGNDPSASNPVYIRIGDTVRSITSALSVTKNDGTNWFNAGSTELATKEIDYFVYLGYNATDGVVIGFSRIPYACSYDDFSATSTNEKYCAISTITNASATDYYEVIGRFPATLSAGAGYTWTVPTFTAKNLIQRPVYETRRLTFNFNVASWTGTAPSGTNNHYTENYQIRGRVCRVEVMMDWVTPGTTITSAVTNPLPISVGNTYNNLTFGKIFVDGGGGYVAGGDNTTIPQFRSANTITMFCSSQSAKAIGIIGEYDIT